MAAAEAFRKGTVQALDLTGRTACSIDHHALLGRIDRSCVSWILLTANWKLSEQRGWEHMFRYVVAPGTYPGQEQPINTIAQMNVLAVTSTLNSEVVYALNQDSVRKS